MKDSMLKRFVHYYKPHKKIFILDLIASFLVAAIGIGYPIITNMLMKDFIPNELLELYEKNKEYQQYYPDFYLPKYDIYIEYFGIDENNNVAPYLKDKNLVRFSINLNKN